MISLCARPLSDVEDDRDLLRGQFPYAWTVVLLFLAADLASTITVLANL